MHLLCTVFHCVLSRLRYEYWQLLILYLPLTIKINSYFMLSSSCKEYILHMQICMYVGALCKKLLLSSKKENSTCRIFFCNHLQFTTCLYWERVQYKLYEKFEVMENFATVYYFFQECVTQEVKKFEIIKRNFIFYNFFYILYKFF